jgi:hypothetical protein
MRSKSGWLPLRLEFNRSQLAINKHRIYSESSHAISSASRFQRGAFPGLEEPATFSSALRFVSTLARA